MDNEAAIQTLSNNQHNYLVELNALMIAQELTYHGWTFFTIWTASYTNIPGNDQANLLAKEGAWSPIPYPSTITLVA
jgi:hypothetical protein